MGTKKLEFVITSGEAGTRLDRCLSRLIPDSSRSFLQKLIRDGMVRADGAAVDVPRYPVRAGMRIEVDLPEEAAAEPSPEPFDFPILYEDESMLVIDKPPGVVVHPAAGNPTGTVVNALLGRYPQLAEELACGNSRPGIVHRLDKDTSGCLVIAKTASAQFKLSGAFAGRETAKTYLALVRGVPKRPSGELSNLIGRHPVNRKKMAVVERCGKLAVTRYRLDRAGAGGAAPHRADPPDPGSSFLDRVSGAGGCSVRGRRSDDRGVGAADAARLEVAGAASGQRRDDGVHRTASGGFPAHSGADDDRWRVSFCRGGGTFR